MNHAERCESVRHCRWVDEIVSDAPWVIDQAFLDKHRIDYVAHDEDPYKGSDGSDDVYGFCKSIGTREVPDWAHGSDEVYRSLHPHSSDAWRIYIRAFGAHCRRLSGRAVGSQANQDWTPRAGQ